MRKLGRVLAERGAGNVEDDKYRHVTVIRHLAWHSRTSSGGDIPPFLWISYEFPMEMLRGEGISRFLGFCIAIILGEMAKGN